MTPLLKVEPYVLPVPPTGMMLADLEFLLQCLHLYGARKTKDQRDNFSQAIILLMEPSKNLK
jgi:hypothetical protein